MDKQTLRKLALQKRKELSAGQLEDLSNRIVENFKGLAFQNVQFLHLFYPIAGKHEFNTLLLAEWVKKAHPQIKLVLSKSNVSDFTLEHFIWNDLTPLSMNQWGITEPADGIRVAPAEIDMVLIPLLAYDIKGNRIGYGKGFYDRFLAQCREETLKYGISFFGPEEKEFKVDEFDVPIDLCITPQGIIYF